MIRTLLAAGLFLSPALGQEIDFEFFVYSTEPDIGVALEDRLVTGGEPAVAAMEKLPDLVRQGRVTELATLSLKIPSGERTKGTSSDATLALPHREAVAGLEVEVDPVVQGGIVDFNLYACFTTDEKDQPTERIVTTQTRGRSGDPLLLCRWQLDDEWLLFVGKATLPDGPGSGPPPDDLLFVESSFYPSGSSARFGRDKLASTRIPCRSGQRARASIVTWLDDENILEDDQPGFRSQIDPRLADDGTLVLGVACGYIVEAGGRTRLDSGERVRRLEMRSVKGSLELTEGEPAGQRATVAGLNDVRAEEDEAVAAFVFIRAG